MLRALSCALLLYVAACQQTHADADAGERAAPGVDDCLEPELCKGGTGSPVHTHELAPDGTPCTLTCEAATVGEYCWSEPECAGDCNGTKCVSLPGVGEPCAVDPSENAPTFCAASAWCFQGTCLKRGEEGEACEPDFINTCVGALDCWIEDKKCHAPGAIHQPCEVLSLKTCEPGLWCSRESKTCELPVDKGAVCNPAWTSCKDGLTCACSNDCDDVSPDPTPTDTCQPFLEEGLPCHVDSNCLSGMCIANKCAAARVSP